MPDFDHYRFTEAFPYLLAKVGVRMEQLFAAELREAGLTLPMYRVMAALREQEDQRLIDLAEMVSSELSTLSRLVGKMITMRHVTRKRLTDDGRTVCIALTPAGRTLVERWIPRAIYYEQLATAGLDTTQLKQLKRLMDHIFANLHSVEIGEPLPEPEPAAPARKRAAPAARKTRG
ncbi:MarR family winged helix-turn-helix transcriptional regulator [Burkholderia sp. Ac-20379]|uniref:MarR family winged helix-turn-helix transcriptional regulator n=1 Tax=Burkholderia sp. Ac-20379 TaxID=2703900 RepID=UPI00197D3096|nr:MarR family transcriptional regulator [Burkholderia sp. Ac-20379]MBN3724223.1 MarR family transcriptional regulator [Burkholderia sp. Ac-20379]